MIKFQEQNNKIYNKAQNDSYIEDSSYEFYS